MFCLYTYQKIDLNERSKQWKQCYLHDVIQFDPIFVIFLVKNGSIPFYILITNYILLYYAQSSEHTRSDGVNSYCVFSSLIAIVTIAWSDNKLAGVLGVKTIWPWRWRSRSPDFDLVRDLYAITWFQKNSKWFKSNCVHKESHKR